MLEHKPGQGGAEQGHEKHALWSEGANHTCDLVATRKNANGELELLLILRNNGKWALPGGFRDKKGAELEDAEVGAIREGKEETGLDFSLLTLTKGYEGIVEDSRNEGTPGEPGSRWIETTAFYADATGRDEFNDPKGGDDARGAQWTLVTPELLDGLHANHGQIVRETLRSQTQEGVFDF